MSRGNLPFLFLLFLGLSATASVPATKDNKALFDLWNKIAKPLKGPSEPIGSYAAGCLGGARTLPLDGEGYAVMRPSRHRNYGHPDLLAFIRSLGSEVKKEGLPLLLVGDMGRPRGGPMKTGHNSHQIGLDVDLWYTMLKKKPTRKERESLSAEDFVELHDDMPPVLRPAWTDEYRKLVTLAAASPYVNRIFVHPSIKRDLCEKFKDAPWLYKFRAWWGHHEHFHVRLNCPEGSGHCKSQDALDPKVTQCGADLDWWFSAEAIEEGKKKAAAFSERDFPELPEECGKMVAGLRARHK
ncbi:MAG TPA: penicillin-insensitive murein endopeptidase [Bdellovibrionota bacterium]|jgi:penicillin-insensitive murein endopeptidase